MKIQYIFSVIVLLLLGSSSIALHAEDFVFKTVLSKEVSRSYQPPSRVDCDGNAVTPAPDPYPYTAVEIMKTPDDFTAVSFVVYYTDNLSTPLYSYLNNSPAAVNFNSTTGEISYTMTGIAQTRKSLTARVYLNATGTGSPFQDKEFYTSQAKTGPPVGSIMPFYGTAAAAAALELGGWFLCDGRAISSISNDVVFPDEKTALIAVVGNNLPDLRGLFLRGIDPDGTYDPTPNRPRGDVQSHAVQNHTHSGVTASSTDNHNITLSTGTVAVQNGSGTTVINSVTLNNGNHNHTISTSGTTGNMATGNTSTETRPVNAAVNYLIKVRH